MDINEILAKVGITVSEEKIDEFNKLVRTNYKSLAEVNKLRGEIDNLKEKNTELEKLNETSKQQSLNNADLEAKHQKEVNELKGKISDYETKFKEVEIDKAISTALSGLKFTSKRVESSVISEIKTKNFELKDGKLDGLDNYLEELKKEDNVFISEKSKPNMHIGNRTSNKDDNNTRNSFLNALFDGMEEDKK